MAKTIIAPKNQLKRSSLFVLRKKWTWTDWVDFFGHVCSQPVIRWQSTV